MDGGRPIHGSLAKRTGRIPGHGAQTMLKVYAVTLAGLYSANGFMVVVAGDKAEAARLALEEKPNAYEVDKVQELPRILEGYLAPVGDEAKGSVIFADFHEE